MKVFVGSFNINAATLASEQASVWLAQAEGADIVALGFQECDQIPAQQFPPPSNLERAGDYVRGVPVSDEDNCQFLACIQKCLPDCQLVADVAIGEPATGCKTAIDGVDTEWYGVIRLLLYLRTGKYPSAGVTTYAVPAGSKPSAHKADYGGCYARGAAPDKGVVAVHMAAEGLLFINAHLCGTNKYGVPEDVFDELRISQLEKAHEVLDKYLPWGVGGCKMVLLGDLNFRVEKFTASEDKSKGGKDFGAVKDAVQGASSLELLKVYKENDRLRYLLDSHEKCPDLLRGCTDCLGVALQAGGIVPPTFTYKANTPMPRPYAAKRTPSWTDRILVRGFSPSKLVFASVREWTISDHEAVFAAFEMDTVRGAQTTVDEQTSTARLKGQGGGSYLLSGRVVFWAVSLAVVGFLWAKTQV